MAIECFFCSSCTRTSHHFILNLGLRLFVRSGTHLFVHRTPVGTLPNQPLLSCAANVQLLFNGTVITHYKEKTYTTRYKFTERSWPRSCTIEFDAYAFQGPRDKVPVRLIYKGTFRRKLLKSSVIQIMGKIYEEQRGGGWRRRTQLVQIGSFAGRRRVMPAVSPSSVSSRHVDDDRDEKEDNESDDYDAYDEYDEYSHEDQNID